MLRGLRFRSLVLFRSYADVRFFVTRTCIFIFAIDTIGVKDLFRGVLSNQVSRRRKLHIFKSNFVLYFRVGDEFSIEFLGMNHCGRRGTHKECHTITLVSSL